MISITVRPALVGFRSCRMLQHSGSVFNGCRFGQPPENAAEVGSIAKAATDGNVLQFEIVIAQKEFAARDTNVSEIVDERHVAVAVEDTRQVVRAHSKNLRDGIARDVVLIVPLQVDADPFEKTLRPVCGVR